MEHDNDDDIEDLGEPFKPALEPILHEIDFLIKWIPQSSAAWVAQWQSWKIYLFHIYEPKKDVNAIYLASDGKSVLIDSNWSGIKKKISDTKPVR